MMAAILFVAGLVLLVAGAESLVRGASKLAAGLGISPLVIGLTVVAFGTSAPEMAVSTMAGLSGQADIALGNVVGSNIFNVLFILGLSAMITPLAVSQQLIRLDVPLMVVVSALVWCLGWDGVIGRWEAAGLFCGLVGYTVFLIRQSRKESAAIRAEYTQEFSGAECSASAGRLRQIAYIAAGLAMLVLGSKWLVDGAVTAARLFGISELIIGLTVVAAGTSLPEVATSVVASIRGERDIAVGNVVGSNIFNTLGVLGVSGALSPHGIRVSPAAMSFDIPVMIAVAAACLPVFFCGNRISRWEGILFFGYYIAYTLYLILAAAQHAALPMFGAVMMRFIIPLTAVTFAVLAWRSVKRRS